jgi:bacterial/archaeal transporter family-2 protein
MVRVRVSFGPEWLPTFKIDRLGESHYFAPSLGCLRPPGETNLQYSVIALITLAGIGLAMQAAINARMSEVVQSPTMSALINFAVGGVLLVVMLVLGIFGRGRLSTIGAAPWWAWTGGILGAIWVTVAIVAVPKVGTALTIAAVIFGQLVGAAVLDTIGLLGVPRIPLSPWRIAGAALLFLGVLMMQHK